MKDIYIRPNEVMSMSVRIRSIAGRASSISQNVRSIVNSLDWEVSAKGSIGTMAAGISGRADGLAERAAALGDRGNKAAQEFRSADARMARNMDSALINMRQVSTNVASLTMASNVNMSIGGNSKKDFFQKVSDWLKKAGEAIKEFGKGLADGIKGLLDGIKDFFAKEKVSSGNETHGSQGMSGSASSQPMVDGKVIGSQEYMDMVDELMTKSAQKYWYVSMDQLARMIAGDGLEQIMTDVRTNGSQLDNMSEDNFIRLCEKVNSLVWQYGAVYEELHYFRNYLNRAPKTLEEMIQLNKNLPSDEKWRLLPPDKAIYHMYGTDGEYNLKFVSADGFFEAVYNKSGTLLTPSNDGVNMGTYNYADPEASAAQHALYDVLPYYSWGNVSGVPKPSTSEFANLDRYNANSDAKNHYNDVLNQIK